ncbi:MAG TPA: diguanylate cyclase [Sphingomonas sp.]
MRQTDVIDNIRDILIGASIEASPENYEICHRFVTRSDARVYNAFKDALGTERTINAKAFGRIKDEAGPARREADIDRQTAKIEEQLALILGATQAALGNTATYSQSLSADADLLQSLGGGADIAAIVAGLLVRTRAMADHSQSLEQSLASAGSELADLRAELEKAKQESGTDVLTALPNRRSFDARLAAAVTRAEASREPLSLAFFDIDHFKAFNDTWGHQLGDHVLRFVGGQMASQFKEIGSAARYGGEEFVLLLPGYGSMDALQVITSFCGSVSTRVLRVRSDGREIGHVTLSAGVATLHRGESAEAVIERADTAMYAAKQAGRNRVLSAA